MRDKNYFDKLSHLLKDNFIGGLDATKKDKNGENKSIIALTESDPKSQLKSV